MCLSSQIATAITRSSRKNHTRNMILFTTLTIALCLDILLREFDLPMVITVIDNEHMNLIKIVFGMDRERGLSVMDLLSPIIT
jgi:hypothetical protein